jgi:hypothetical protein
MIYGQRIQELEAETLRLREENRTYLTNLESLVKARTDQLQATVRELERSYDITLEALGDALAELSCTISGRWRFPTPSCENRAC